MRSYFGTALSENIGKTPEGYLICRNVVVSRTATKKAIPYKESEVFADSGSEKMIGVWRRPEVVFDDASMASLEGKPVCSPHPGMFLSPQNYAAYAKGVVMNVHRGPVMDGEATLLADLIVTDPMLINEILAGRLRECSVGYDCVYTEMGNGEWEQRNIQANHLAIIPKARVGQLARIYDNDPQGETMTLEQVMAELHRITAMIASEQQHATTDAQVEDADSGKSAREYAELVNALGAKMARRACRVPAVVDKTRWPSLTATFDSDSIGEAGNEAQAASLAYDDARSYAETMRGHLRTK